MAVDNTFGPFLLFGQGGVSVEVVGDKSLALAPINTALAMDMITHTRIYKQLKGYRDRPPAAIDDIAAVLVRVSKLICDFPEIIDLDINPLLGRRQGVIAVDARIKLAEPSPVRAISVSPSSPIRRNSNIAKRFRAWGNFSCVRCSPQDAVGFTRFFARLQPDDVRLRFFSPLQDLCRPICSPA